MRRKKRSRYSKRYEIMIQYNIYSSLSYMKACEAMAAGQHSYPIGVYPYPDVEYDYMSSTDDDTCIP